MYGISDYPVVWGIWVATDFLVIILIKKANNPWDIRLADHRSLLS
jgi:hypothetical protein